MPDLQTFIAILTALLVFLTGVFLNYDTIQLRNYQLIIPQWTGLLLAGITFSVVVLDQLLRGLVRLVLKPLYVFFHLQAKLNPPNPFIFVIFISFKPVFRRLTQGTG